MEQTEFKGTPVYLRSAGGVTLHASSFRDSEYVDFHRHGSPYVCLLWNGVLTEQIGRRAPRRCGSLSMIVHPPDELHSNRFEQEGFCVNLQFSQRWCGEMGLGESAFASSVSTRGPLMLLCLEMMQSLFMSPDLVDLEELGAQFAAYNGIHAKFSRRSPSWLSTILERIHDDPIRPVTLRRGAQIAGVHPVYFARAFRRVVGSSLGDYQRQVRLQKAARLLTFTNMQICEIALRCGFSDQSHFTKLLAKYVRVSPGNLRQQSQRSMVRNVQDTAGMVF